jgi:hypothetical protein
VCRAEDIRHEGVMRALLGGGDDGTPFSARAAAALERLDQFLKVRRAAGMQRVHNGGRRLPVKDGPAAAWAWH